MVNFKKGEIKYYYIRYSDEGQLVMKLKPTEDYFGPHGLIAKFLILYISKKIKNEAIKIGNKIFAQQFPGVELYGINHYIFNEYQLINKIFSYN